MKDDYTTNSHYITYTFIFRKVGRMYFFNLGVKGLIIQKPARLLYSSKYCNAKVWVKNPPHIQRHLSEIRHLANWASDNWAGY